MDEAREEARNARLRRADWRFLLPSPRPQRVLCRAGGVLTQAVASIAQEIITESAGGDCDLAVGENPGQDTLAAFHAALRPGGACYIEWSGALGGVSGATRALLAAGFDEVTCYRRWPATDEAPLFWVPVDAPGAAAHVRARGRLRGGRVRRLIATAQAGARALLRGRLGGAISVVARRSGTVEPGPAAWLRERWPGWNLGPTPDQVSLLLATGGPRSVSKVVLLAFAEPSPRPVLVVKAPRVEESVASIRRESHVLECLERRGTRGVPRPLGLREVAGVPLLGETALVGRPLDTVLARGSFEPWSVTVADWLVALGRGGTARPASYWREAIVEPALGRFVDAFGPVVDRGLLRESEAIVRAIGDLPAVPEQRDFGPWNVLVTPSGELAVLDWESAEVEGLPALDLLYYLAYASFHVDRSRDRGSRIASFRRSLAPSSPTGVVRHAVLGRYLEALRLDPAQLAPLRVLVWLIHAQSDVRHATADAGGTPSAERLERSLFLGLWTEEVRRLA